MHMRLFPRVCCALLLLVFHALLQGQSGPTGGLSGAVTDPARHVIPDASIEIRSSTTGFSRRARSNAEGYWDVRFLPTGAYQVQIEANGFQKTVLTDVRVEAAVVQTVPAQLQIGAVADAVTVVGEMPLVTVTSGATSRQTNTLELLQVPPQHHGHDFGMFQTHADNYLRLRLLLQWKRTWRAGVQGVGQGDPVWR